MRAEDLLPDQIDRGTFDGVTVRKGSIGAFLVNARVLAQPQSTPEQRAIASRDIIDLLPALKAVGLFEIMEVRDEPLRAFIHAHCQAEP
jgi:hypothetical protein